MKNANDSFTRLTLSSLKSSSNLRNMILLSYNEDWSKMILNIALKAGILNSNIHIVITAFVSKKWSNPINWQVSYEDMQIHLILFILILLHQ